MPWDAEDTALATRSALLRGRAHHHRGQGGRGHGARWRFARYPGRHEAGGRCGERGDLGSAFLLSLCCHIFGMARADAAPTTSPSDPAALTGSPSDVTSASHYTESWYNRTFLFLFFLCLVPFVAWAWGLLVRLTCPEGQDPDTAWYRFLCRRRAPVGPADGGLDTEERAQKEERQLRNAVFMLFSMDTTKKEDEEAEEEWRKVRTDLRRLRERRRAVTLKRASLLSAEPSLDEGGQERALLPVTAETALADGDEASGSRAASDSTDASRGASSPSLKGALCPDDRRDDPAKADETRPEPVAEVVARDDTPDSSQDLLDGLDRTRWNSSGELPSKPDVPTGQPSATATASDEAEQKDKQSGASTTEQHRANIDSGQANRPQSPSAVASRVAPMESNSRGGATSEGSCPKPPDTSARKVPQRADSAQTRPASKADLRASSPPGTSEPISDAKPPSKGYANTALNIQSDSTNKSSSNNSSNSSNSNNGKVASDSAKTLTSTLEQQERTTLTKSNSKLTGVVKDSGIRDNRIGCSKESDQTPDGVPPVRPVSEGRPVGPVTDSRTDSRTANRDAQPKTAEEPAAAGGQRLAAGGGALSPVMASSSPPIEGGLSASAHLCNSIETIVL